MKTFGKYIVFILVLFNTACEPDDGLVKPPVTPPDTNWKRVSINANLAPMIEDYGDGTMYLRWNGSATSDLTGKVNLFLSHEIYFYDNSDNYDIKGGSFSIWSDNYQHTLMGTYTGRGFETNGQFIMEGQIQVQSGTGSYANEDASLSFSIGRVIPFSVDTAESEILIRGTIKVPAKVPVP